MAMLTKAARRHGLTTVAVAAAALICSIASAAPAPRSASRPSAGACREAVNGLISMLDAGTDDTANYRDTYKAVVETCGPAVPAPEPKEPPPSRAACHDLAAAMVDEIENDQMETAPFVAARNIFAETCAPR